MVAREKVIAFLNSMILDPLPFSFDFSSLQVVMLKAFLSDGAAANVNKDTSAIAGDVGEAISGDSDLMMGILFPPKAE